MATDLFLILAGWTIAGLTVALWRWSLNRELARDWTITRA